MLDKRLFRPALLLTPVVVAALVMGFAPFEPVNPDLELDAWAAQDTEKLPKTLRELLAHPVRVRRVVVRHLPIEAKRELWREHLESFTVHPENRSATQREVAARLTTGLTPSQRDFVLTTISNLDVYFDDTATESQRRARALALCARASELFDQESRAIVFAGLSGPKVATRAPDAQTDSRTGDLKAALVRLKIVSPAATSGNCSCAAGSGCDCTSINVYCIQTSPPCSTTSSGCGCLDFFDCTGVCQLAT